MFIEGKRCRLCGGRITAMTPITDRRDSPLTAGDVRVPTLVPNGRYTAIEVVEYHHVYVGYCDRCSMGYSLDQMVDEEAVSA